MKPHAQISFYYYDNLEEAADFYENILGFELVQDQKMARLYRTSSHSFFGIVDGSKGHLRSLPESAVLLTLVVDDVYEWHSFLKEKGVEGLSEVKKGVNAESLFFKDPAGYAIEVQRFLDPEVAKRFK